MKCLLLVIKVLNLIYMALLDGDEPTAISKVLGLCGSGAGILGTSTVRTPC